MSVWWLLPFVVGVSFFLTWVLRRYALARSLLDVPNARSSHSIPTPRGGGVAIVLGFLAVLPVLNLAGLLQWKITWTLLCSGAGVALLGFLDDHGHVPVRWRLLGHLLAAVWVVYWLGGLPLILLFGFEVDLDVFGHAAAVLYLVWLLNLYNFMDGIDGIASIEAVCVCLGGAVLYFFLGEPAAAVLSLLLAAAVTGFLLWNFPPAKIFMGDAGSGFLGLMLGALSLQAAWVAPQLLWSWAILLGVFIVDATFTLLRRLIRGEKVYEAHRSHAYQYASRYYKAHKPVSMAVGVINIAWLFPWAFSVAAGMIDGAVATVIAYVPLVLLAIRFNAGTRERAA